MYSTLITTPANIAYFLIYRLRASAMCSVSNLFRSTANASCTLLLSRSMDDSSAASLRITASNPTQSGALGCDDIIPLSYSPARDSGISPSSTPAYKLLCSCSPASGSPGTSGSSFPQRNLSNTSTKIACDVSRGIAVWEQPATSAINALSSDR